MCSPESTKGQFHGLLNGKAIERHYFIYCMKIAVPLIFFLMSWEGSLKPVLGSLALASTQRPNPGQITEPPPKASNVSLLQGSSMSSFFVN